jgi:hypothetical protein
MSLRSYFVQPTQAILVIWSKVMLEPALRSTDFGDEEINHETK